ncbi:hypothetical protein ACTJLD_01015 [Burkholderia sp. 22088]|uniref:hypothetical protein n=1 Tax=Burkholderia sp. 22088 TaxID=3453871 RepID=UPI003F8717A7
MSNDNVLTDECAAVLRLCVSELRAWMKDHGKDIRSQDPIARANALLAAHPDQPEPRAEVTECCNHTWESCHKGDGCEFRIWLGARTGASS